MNATARMSRYDSEGRIIDIKDVAVAMTKRRLPACEDGGVWVPALSIGACDSCPAEQVPGVTCGVLDMCPACADAEVKRAAAAEPCMCVICNEVAK